jgi:hypothetical protein
LFGGYFLGEFVEINQEFPNDFQDSNQRQSKIEAENSSNRYKNIDVTLHESPEISIGRQILHGNRYFSSIFRPQLLVRIVEYFVFKFIACSQTSTSFSGLRNFHEILCQAHQAMEIADLCVGSFCAGHQVMGAIAEAQLGVVVAVCVTG